MAALMTSALVHCMLSVVDPRAPPLAMLVAKPSRDTMLTKLPAATERVGVSWTKLWV